MSNDPALPEFKGQRPGATDDPRLDWWREVRFGMFIHWGLYAITAGTWNGEQIPKLGEWIMKHAQIPLSDYAALAPRFNPVEFNAAEVVALAKAAEQKYIVFTSKHHDGFCMFKSDHTGYNIVDATPFKRDIVKELADECARQNMRFGLYYSQTQDWHEPGGVGNDWDTAHQTRDFDTYLTGFVEPQLRELLTNYGPIAVLWFDTPRDITVEQSHRLYDLVRELQPDCLICGRVGNGLGDFASSGDNKAPSSNQATLDWETPATINDTWGFKSYDHNWKSTTTLIQHLANIASKGGNYLLNIGPDAQGNIPLPSVERLEAVGAWMRVNDESITGTKAGPVQDVDGIRSTQKGETVYLHVFDWPADGKITVPAAGLPANSVHLLADASVSLELVREGDLLVIQGPSTAPDLSDTVIVLR